MQGASDGFFKEHPYTVARPEFDRKGGYYNLRVQDGPFVLPIEWSVLIGEIAHDLRSALDGLVWQLALLNPNISEPYFQTAFPICRVGYGRRGKGGRHYPCFWVWHKKTKRLVPLYKLQSVEKRFVARIEAFQPYKRGNQGRYNPLLLLEELNNTDKHRLVTVLGTNMRGFVFTGLAGGRPRDIHVAGNNGASFASKGRGSIGSEYKIGVPLKANAKIGQVYPLPLEGVRLLDVTEDGRLRMKDGKIQTRIEHEVQVNLSITPQIRFGSGCDAVERLPVIRTLQGMANEVSRVIESFSGEFN